MDPARPGESASSGGRFQTTRWSLVISSVRDGTAEARAHEALTQLCRIYWRPIYAFIVRQGHSDLDAQDLTQDFFLAILKGGFLEKADPGRGRFRSFLLKSLQNFLRDARDKARALKRGGGANVIAWDEWMAEAPSHLTIPTAALERWPPERVFDVRWAATLAEQALRRLAEECESRGRRRVFDTLSKVLVVEGGDVSYEELARELSITSADVKRLLHQLRQRYRKLLRAEIAHTVENKTEVEEELRYLISALAHLPAS
jgi:RNA polymerase sigma-70 factor (ECF subfamily)